MSKQGPEDLLLPGLEAAVNGRTPTTDEHMKHDLTAALGGPGSQNWGPLAWATRLLLKIAGAVEEWLAYFKASESCWMGSEVGTRVYWSFFLCAIAAVYAWAKAAGNEVLRKAAEGWLVTWWRFIRSVRTKAGRVLWLGNRSAGHPTELEDGVTPEPGFLEWIVAEAFGEDSSQWDAAMHASGWGPKNRSEYRILKQLMWVLKETAALTADEAPAAGMMDSFHAERTTRGLAVWMDKAVNSNTDPVLGAVEIDGKVCWLPARGGPSAGREFRNQAGLPEECVETADKLIYDSGVYGHQEEEKPPGALISRRDWGLPLAAQAPIVPPAPDAPPPPNGSAVAMPSAPAKPKKSWWQRIFG